VNLVSASEARAVHAFVIISNDFNGPRVVNTG
jgi:hypothetical protein